MKWQAVPPKIGEVVGAPYMVIGKFTGAPTHPAELVSTALTFPEPAAPQFTVMLLALPPLTCTPPPEIVQT